MSEQNQARGVSVRGAVALGIGSMVGAGIFALMGEAAAKAGGAVWLSFLVAGIIALLTGHSFAQLGMRYPSRGGVVEYLVKAYGVGRFSGGCSILFYIAQLIGMAMISLAFGRFAAKLLGLGEANLLLWERVLASGLIVGLAALAAYQVSGLVAFDAAGALAAAVLMSAASIVLMTQARALITGRALPDDELDRLQAVVLATPGVEAANRLAAIYSGAAEVLVDADLDLAPDLDTAQIEALLDDLEARIRAAIPEAGQLRVLLNSPETPAAEAEDSSGRT